METLSNMMGFSKPTDKSEEAVAESEGFGGLGFLFYGESNSDSGTGTKAPQTQANKTSFENFALNR